MNKRIYKKLNKLHPEKTVVYRRDNIANLLLRDGRLHTLAFGFRASLSKAEFEVLEKHDKRLPIAKSSVIKNLGSDIAYMRRVAENNRMNPPFLHILTDNPNLDEVLESYKGKTSYDLRGFVVVHFRLNIDKLIRLEQLESFFRTSYANMFFRNIFDKVKHVLYTGRAHKQIAVIYVKDLRDMDKILNSYRDLNDLRDSILNNCAVITKSNILNCNSIYQSTVVIKHT